jgi:uncharacterized C2H2 Zn-finger protein
MEMGTGEEISRIQPEGEIFACPACGYTDGFHVSFCLSEPASGGEIYLICPSCHRRFRIGWKVQME